MLYSVQSVAVICRQKIGGIGKVLGISVDKYWTVLSVSNVSYHCRAICSILKIGLSEWNIQAHLEGQQSFQTMYCCRRV